MSCPLPSMQVLLALLSTTCLTATKTPPTFPSLLRFDGLATEAVACQPKDPSSLIMSLVLGRSLCVSAKNKMSSSQPAKKNAACLMYDEMFAENIVK